MPGISIGSSEYDGILMYVIHDGYQTANQVISDANTVWYEESEHVSASMYGVAETNLMEDPEAEILQQTHINRLPTLLFVRVVNGQMMSILSRLEGMVPQSRIRSEFRRLLQREPVYESGESGGVEDWLNGDGEGGWGLGGCPKWMPSVICDFPLWLVILIVATIILLILKLRK